MTKRSFRELAKSFAVPMGSHLTGPAHLEGTIEVEPLVLGTGVGWRGQSECFSTEVGGEKLECRVTVTVTVKGSNKWETGQVVATDDEVERLIKHTTTQPQRDAIKRLFVKRG